MLLLGYKNEGNWLIAGFELTYGVSWEGLTKGAALAYNDLKGCEVLSSDMLGGESVAKIEKPEDICAIPEAAKLIVRGQSKALNTLVMLEFFNQTRVVQVSLAKMSEEFKDTDYEKLNRSLCHYITSIEIAMMRG